MPCGWERSQSSAATVHFKEVAPVVIPQAADWENATVYERNKEQGHATYMPYPSTAAMRPTVSVMTNHGWNQRGQTTSASMEHGDCGGAKALSLCS